MTHTHTTVYRDYSADTLAYAAAQMLLDPEIWSIEGAEVEGSILAVVAEGKGRWAGYVVESWDWDGRRLRVWFR